MGIQYFGQFLLSRKTISQAQLDQAVQWQAENNLGFGTLCVRQGLLTPAQVDDLYRRQKGEDRRFGELAVAAGFLTQEKVDKVLAQQSQSHVYLGEALVQLKILTQPQLDSELSTFAVDQEPYVGRALVTPSNIREPEWVDQLVQSAQVLLLRLAQVLTKKAAPRIVEPASVTADHHVAISIHGAHTVYLSVSAGIAKQIAAGLAGSALDEDQALKEFFKLVVKNAARKLSPALTAAEPSPPQNSPGVVSKAGEVALLCPLLAIDDKVCLVFVGPPAKRNELN